MTPIEPGCLAEFSGGRTKEGVYIGSYEVMVLHGPWHNETPCLACGSRNLLYAVDGIPDSDGCCHCRLRRLDGAETGEQTMSEK